MINEQLYKKLSGQDILYYEVGCSCTKIKRKVPNHLIYCEEEKSCIKIKNDCTFNGMIDFI